MDEHLTFAYWLFQPQAWIVLGIALVILDIFLGYTLFILPFGVAAFIVAALVFADHDLYPGRFNLLADWKAVLIWYAGISLVSIFIIKLLFQKKLHDRKDINDY